MTSLTAERPPRESHLMDEDRAPRRTSITIRVSEVDPATHRRREVCRISAGYDRDVDIPQSSPSEWPPCTCPRCGVAR
jgi:hypothetical protein